MRVNPDWIIYTNGVGGWFAWNQKTAKEVKLVFIGSFSEAVGMFEKPIGLYWK